MIIKTKLVPKPYSGITVWPFIFVTPWADATVIPHEMVHYKRQAWWSPIWWMLYLLVPWFRLEEEMLAYKESIQCGMSVENAATWLMSYHANISKENAIDLLSKK